VKYERILLQNYTDNVIKISNIEIFSAVLLNECDLKFIKKDSCETITQHSFKLAIMYIVNMYEYSVTIKKLVRV